MEDRSQGRSGTNGDGTDVDTIETPETKHSYIYRCSGPVWETTQLHSAIKSQPLLVISIVR